MSLRLLPALAVARGLAVGLSARAAASISAGAVHVEPSFLTGRQLDEARVAAEGLRYRGSAAVIGKHAAAAARVRDCATLDLLDDAVWSQLPASLLHVVSMLEDLRSELAACMDRPLVESTELQLLHYRAG